MKALTILGAIVGFLLGAGFGLTANSPWPDALWRACAAAILAAVLTRWGGRVWIGSLRDTLDDRQQIRNIPPADRKAATKL